MAINGTLELIDSVTVPSGGQAAIEFLNIPQTYDDLVIKLSARSSTTYGNAWYEGKLRLNSSDGSSRELYGTGSAAGSGTEAAQIRILGITSSGATANTFGSADIYISGYRTSNNKSVSIDSVSENNATASISALASGLWSNSAAVTSLQLVLLSSANFAEHSTAYLYGVSRVPAGAKATGGVIYSDNNYWYHAFTSSGVFTPSQSLSCDVLVVAGGGGGGGASAFGTDGAGGGGAGGLLAFSAQSLSTTNYTVTVGAGGNSVTNSTSNGGTGSDSQFGALTLVKGGGGGGGNTNAGSNGGSGGGGSFQAAGGTATSGQGNNGGTGPTGGNGGGGGAGAVGLGSATASDGGNGGNGVATYSSWLEATSKGQNISGNFYIAGGGGGSGDVGSGIAGTGGFGGGGIGSQLGASPAGSGLPYTGGGGGGAGPGNRTSGAGGSGIVIVRYAK